MFRFSSRLWCMAAATPSTAASSAGSSPASSSSSSSSRDQRKRISVKNAVVEMDGDEMARVIFSLVRDKLVLPFVDLKTEYFDLGIQNRDATNDVVSDLAADAVRHYNVGIKCATITPDEERSAEFNLKKLWRSSNGVLRHKLNGTLFREPIIISNDFPRPIPNWTQPIVVARHGRGDQYASFDSRCGKGKIEVIFTPVDGGKPKTIEVGEVGCEGGGVVMCMFNEKDSIESFARTTFDVALQRKMPVVLSTKNTISRHYDGFFIKIFETIFEKSYKTKFDSAKLTYEHRLIDDQVAQAIKSKGGFIWALKNYDGDIQADAVAQGFGSPGLISSLLICGDGKTVISEVGHGTVTRHFRDHQKGKATSVNSMATIFAWSQGLAHRGRLDENAELVKFSETLEKAARDTIVVNGIMTKDLAMLKFGGGDSHLAASNNNNNNTVSAPTSANNNTKDMTKDKYKSTEEFIDCVCEELIKKLNAGK